MAYTLTEIRPDDRRGMEQLRALLEGEGISLDANLDYTCGLLDEDYNLAATGSTFGNTLRCFAVAREHQGEGLLNQVVSHLMERQMERGMTHLFVYTKTGSAKFFRDLGFYEIARVEGTLSFLENRRGGFASFCKKLEETRRLGSAAAIVMNANPFTLGHQYLVERAAAENDTVHLFVLSEEGSLVPFAARWQMVTAGVAHLKNVVCHQTGPYLISAATFPSYFLRDEETVIRSHARLDLELFLSIAQVLGVTARYAGEEPFSQVTGIYNQVMAQLLPERGIRFVEIPRRAEEGQTVSASAVRRAIRDGRMEEMRAMVPQTTWDFFQSPQGQAVAETIRRAGDVTHY